MLPMPKAPHALMNLGNDEVLVGVAERDITPPIGLGMFGHGPEGRVAVGIQLRLRCQVFVIIGSAQGNEEGGAVALIPCDLSAPSLLLQRKVAELAQAKGVHLGASDIMLMATHTHAAPGHFYGVKNYVSLLTSRVLGFDERVFNFLASTIASGLVEAYDAAKKTPGRIGWSQGLVTSTLSRNRNPQAILQNKHAPIWLAEKIETNRGRADEAAVDPTISVLRIDRRVRRAEGDRKAEYAPYGVFATFGTHPTALSNTQDLYSGDLFGYATRYAASKIKKVQQYEPKADVVVGIGNGIEGDVMPARTAANVREARRFGRALSEEIVARWQLLEPGDGLDTKATVRVAYRELSLSGAKTSSTAKRDRDTCERPELGTAMGSGAADHHTLLRIFPQFNSGVVANDTEGQRCGRPKLPILLPFNEARPDVDFPGHAPITVAQIGTHYVVGLPAEVTTVAGARIRDAVADELKPHVPITKDNVGREIVVLGLVNEFIQYVATRDEYRLQLYEGASTLYGPASAELLTDQAACLAHWLNTRDDASCRHGQSSNVNVVGDLKYPEPSQTDLMSDDTKSPAMPKELELKTTISPEGLLAFSVRFQGPEPELVKKRDDLRVEVFDVTKPDAVVDDEGGTAITLRHHPYGKNTWTATWLPELTPSNPDHESLCSKTYKFRIGSRPKDNEDFTNSEPFKVDCNRLPALSKEWP
jgi:neutral ceramidase